MPTVASLTRDELGARLAGHGLRLQTGAFVTRLTSPIDGVAVFRPLPLDQAFPMFEWGLNWCVSSRAHSYYRQAAAPFRRAARFLGRPDDARASLSWAVRCFTRCAWRSPCLIRRCRNGCWPNRRNKRRAPSCLALMDWLFGHALLPAHASCKRPGSGAARLALYIRANWLRIPPLLLARHLFHKALISPRDP